MKKILTILLSICLLNCYAFKQTSEIRLPQTNFKSVNTYNIGSNQQYSITPVCSTNIYYENEVYAPSHNKRRVGGHPNDPYPTPIGDIPYLMLICFLIYYVYKKKTASI